MSNLLVQNIKHTNGTTAQTIDSSGRVLTPARPAFSVKNAPSSQAVLNGHVTFDTVTFNIGNGWDGTNKFQAPIAGAYFFSLTAFSADSSGGSQDDGAGVKVYIEQDTDSSFGSPTMIASMYTYVTGADGYYNCSISGMASLAASEYVRVNVAAGYIYTSNTASGYPPIFTGFLVG
jgi:hypothetical protein